MIGWDVCVLLCDWPRTNSKWLSRLFIYSVIHATTSCHTFKIKKTTVFFLFVNRARINNPIIIFTFIMHWFIIKNIWYNNNNNRPTCSHNAPRVVTFIYMRKTKGTFRREHLETADSQVTGSCSTQDDDVEHVSHDHNSKITWRKQRKTFKCFNCLFVSRFKSCSD